MMKCLFNQRGILNIQVEKWNENVAELRFLLMWHTSDPVSNMKRPDKNTVFERMEIHDTSIIEQWENLFFVCR